MIIMGDPKDFLPADQVLHKRESDWMKIFQKYEEAFKPFENYTDDQFECAMLNETSDEEEEELFEIADENEAPLDVVDEDDGEEDYLQFADMLTEGKKAIVERKKLWQETGDSFILDQLAETTTTSVNDWVKQNLDSSEAATNLDISTLYGNKCKERKMQSTFLENSHRMASNSTTPKKKAVVQPRQSDLKTPCPSMSSQTRFYSGVSRSESTFNRRRIAPPTAIKRGMFQSVKRLSTVPESPSTAAAKASPIRRSYSIGDLKLPRERTVIYSPMQPIVQEMFKDVLKKDWFDPNKMLVYEPPSDVNSSSESDDDIFLTAKRKFGGKIYEI